MKFSESWLREIIDIKLNSSELSHKLTMLGHEVDSVITDGSDIDGIVIAEIVNYAKHPNADRLSLCEINYGNNNHINVICGAPNVRTGPRVRKPYFDSGNLNSVQKISIGTSSEDFRAFLSSRRHLWYMTGHGNRTRLADELEARLDRDRSAREDLKAALERACAVLAPAVAPTKRGLAVRDPNAAR